MLIKCQIVKLLSLVILVRHTTIYKYVYSTDPGGGGVAQGAHQPSSNNNSQVKEGVDLDIKKKKTTNHFTYTKSGSNNKVHTYEPKPGYGFNKVKQKKTLGKDKTVWETTDSKEYAKKVIFDDGNNTVTITLSNGSSKNFKKISGGCCGTDKKWSEETSSGGQNGSQSGATEKTTTTTTTTLEDGTVLTLVELDG